MSNLRKIVADKTILWSLLTLLEGPWKVQTPQSYSKFYNFGLLKLALGCSKHSFGTLIAGYLRCWGKTGRNHLLSQFAVNLHKENANYKAWVTLQIKLEVISLDYKAFGTTQNNHFSSVFVTCLLLSMLCDTNVCDPIVNRIAMMIHHDSTKKHICYKVFLT